jgi:hypothetical protein
MKSVTVFCDRVYAAKVNPEKFMTQIKDWEDSGYRVNFQIQDEAGLTFLQSVVRAQQDTVPSKPFPYAGLFLLGIVSGLITFSVGLMGLLR